MCIRDSRVDRARKEGPPPDRGRVRPALARHGPDTREPRGFPARDAAGSRGPESGRSDVGTAVDARMKIAVAQIDTTVGDFSGNSAKILELGRRAEREGADLVLFPELAVCGYPPRDLVERRAFVLESERAAA